MFKLPSSKLSYSRELSFRLNEIAREMEDLEVKVKPEVFGIMAARRVAVSAIDWAAFKQRVPPAQQEFYKAFKTKNDYFVNRVQQFPAELPQIDFSYYKRKLPARALVDDLQGGYECIKVPYPTDKNNTIQDINFQEKEAIEASKKYVAERQRDIDDAKLVLSKIDSLPKPEEMTMEMYAYYFPEKAINPNRPTFWPHIPKIQPGHKDSHLI